LILRKKGGQIPPGKTYQLYLQLNDIDHTKTKVKSPQTNGICKRFHQTVLNEFCRVTFRKKIYSDIEALQNDLDECIMEYNWQRTQQRKRCKGTTPMETFIEGKKLLNDKYLEEKMMAA